MKGNKKKILSNQKTNLSHAKNNNNAGNYATHIDVAESE